MDNELDSHKTLALCQTSPGTWNTAFMIVTSTDGDFTERSKDFLTKKSEEKVISGRYIRKKGRSGRIPPGTTVEQHGASHNKTNGNSKEKIYFSTGY